MRNEEMKMPLASDTGMPVPELLLGKGRFGESCDAEVRSQGQRYYSRGGEGF